VIVSVSADVIALLNNQTRLAELRGNSFRQDRPGKTGANN
jgi:hypothetical protein